MIEGLYKAAALIVLLVLAGGLIRLLLCDFCRRSR